MDYWNNQSAAAASANYNMGHAAAAGYAAGGNFGLSPAGSLNGSMHGGMGGQSVFGGGQNGLDYMSQQDKYMNMNVNA